MNCYENSTVTRIKVDKLNQTTENVLIITVCHFEIPVMSYSLGHILDLDKSNDTSYIENSSVLSAVEGHVQTIYIMHVDTYIG